MLQGIALAHRYPPVIAKVEIDGRSYEDHYLLALISNCRRYAGGGLTISPQAKLDDGQFEVLLFQGSHIAKLFQYGAMMKIGKRDFPGIEVVNGRHITIHTTPTMPCQTDGEPYGRSPITSILKPRALRILVPDGAPQDLFQEDTPLQLSTFLTIDE